MGLEDPLEKEMATFSSILAWRIPLIEEPGRLQSMGLQESQLSDLIITTSVQVILEEKIMFFCVCVKKFFNVYS